MSDPSCFSIPEAIEQISSSHPGVPILALGQTVFWDEPMKAGLALEARKSGVEFVAGVHDTDYFAKTPGAKSSGRKFETLPHNDGSTRALWSAAAEFSALFGSETVVTKDALLKAGLRFDRLAEVRPGFMDEATEAWGWRGIVSLEENPPITVEVSADLLAKELCNTLRWAISLSAESVGGDRNNPTHSQGEKLHQMLCDAIEAPNQTLASVYRQLLEPVYSFAAGQPVSLTSTQTSELLRFNSQTWNQPRFEMLARFVQNGTRKEACDAYNQAITGYPGLYELSKFGSGAIPFDLVVPGHGRGTIRLGNRGAVIMTRKPLFLSYKKPIESLEEFASLVEAKFGPNCTIVGKAVALIGMLGKEFIFAFHEGASGYVSASKKLHTLLGLQVNPILRVRYQTWNSLSEVCSWIKLPEPFRQAFGSDDLCAPSFAARWQEVGLEQSQLLAKLGELRKPIDLVHFLEGRSGGAWGTQANEYEQLHGRLQILKSTIEELEVKRSEVYNRRKQIRVEWQTLQKEMGDHFRAHLFGQEGTPEHLAERRQFVQMIEGLRLEREELKVQIGLLGQQQREEAQTPEVVKANRRRREIELEAELKRLKLIRDAVISSKGLVNANRRPSAWWLPLVSPDGKWFQQITKTAECYWEPMS